MKPFNNQFATQKLRENFDQSKFNANKLWDFLETKPFYNKEYMPKFNTAEEIWAEFGPKEKQMYADYEWDGDPNGLHYREQAALKRRATYDALAGKKTDDKSDYMKHREDPEYYEKEFKKTGTSDYFQRRGLDEEGSVTGTGATMTPGTGEQYATPKAFKKKNEEKDVEPKLAAGKAKVYMKDKWGWKDAPSIPNRPSKGGFIYKQLFESEQINEIAVNLDLSEEQLVKLIQVVKGHLGTELDLINTLQAALGRDVDAFPHLKENYSKFRKETKTKTNEQQFHAAVRLAEKKINEANRILEYTAQLKSELSVIKENKNTQKLMERITRGIAEAYGKMKKLKL